MREEEVQATVDTIIDAHQQKEGLVATIHHTSDGTCPTCVYSLGAGAEDRVAPPVQPSTWDRLMEGYVPPQMEQGHRMMSTAADSELQVKAVTDALLAATSAKEYRSMATNTGGVKWTPKKEVKKKVLSAE